jgi:hypothetical protein
MSEDAVVELIGSDTTSLRIPPERTARTLLGVIFSSQFAIRLRQDHTFRVDPADVDELVDVFLHGVLMDRPPVSARGNA